GLYGWRITRAPACSANSPLPSLEQSSTTMISNWSAHRWRTSAAPVTTAAIDSASSKTGMTRLTATGCGAEATPFGGGRPWPSWQVITAISCSTRSRGRAATRAAFCGQVQRMSTQSELGGGAALVAGGGGQGCRQCPFAPQRQHEETPQRVLVLAAAVLVRVPQCFNAAAPADAEGVQ